MTENLRYDYPYFEDFGGETSVFLDKLDGQGECYSAFNPSIGYSEKHGYAMLVRSSNYSIIPETRVIDLESLVDIKNEVWFTALDEETMLPTVLHRLIIRGVDTSGFGVEDGRLFSRDGDWYFLGTILKYNEAGTRISRLATFRIDLDTYEAHFIERFESWSQRVNEKNWMVSATEANPNFDYIYSPVAIYKDKKIVLSTGLDEGISEFRGSTQAWPLGDGTYLSLCHRVYSQTIEYPAKEEGKFWRTSYRTYTHAFTRFDAYGSMIEISEEFVFDGIDIEFAAGLVEKDGVFYISYGRMDASSHIATIPRNKVMELLAPLADESEDF